MSSKTSSEEISSRSSSSSKISDAASIASLLVTAVAYTVGLALISPSAISFGAKSVAPKRFAAAVNSVHTVQL
eukprot:scaffold1638_cov258-Pinguiococcus_pyrenoidosus.AAC.104